MLLRKLMAQRTCYLSFNIFAVFCKNIGQLTHILQTLLCFQMHFPEEWIVFDSNFTVTYFESPIKNTFTSNRRQKGGCCREYRITKQRKQRKFISQCNDNIWTILLRQTVLTWDAKSIVCAMVLVSLTNLEMMHFTTNPNVQTLRRKTIILLMTWKTLPLTYWMIIIKILYEILISTMKK